MSNDPIKLVLFDLGGVLVQLGDELFPSSWFSVVQEFGLRHWFSSPAAIEFETGLISTKEFIDELKQSLSISAPYSEVLAAFRTWPKGLYPGTDMLLTRLKADYQVAVLSNSNEIHEPILMKEFGLETHLDNIFFSHLIGHSKPNPKAFNHVLDALDFMPAEVIFFDDNLSNVRAAQSLGMQAYQVFSPLDVGNYI